MCRPIQPSCVAADSPRVTCTPVEANVDDTNVCIRCEIDAKPRSSSVTWVVDNNGTLLADGQVLDGFSTISTVGVFIHISSFGFHSRQTN